MIGSLVAYGIAAFVFAGIFGFMSLVVLEETPSARFVALTMLGAGGPSLLVTLARALLDADVAIDILGPISIVVGLSITYWRMRTLFGPPTAPRERERERER